MVKNRKGLCIGSMILGIISILMCAIQPIIFVASIVGIIIGIVGLKTTDGKGMAIAGIIMSAVGALIGALFMLLVVKIAGAVDNAIDFNSPEDNFYFHYEEKIDDYMDGFEFDNDSNLI